MNFKVIAVGVCLGTAFVFVGRGAGVNCSWNLGTTVVSAAENEEANEAKNHESDPAAEDKELSAKIKREKAEGNDVSAAVAHQKKGEAALKAGNTKEALEHFEEAEHALAEVEEREGKEHEKGEKGGY